MKAKKLERLSGRKRTRVRFEAREDKNEPEMVYCFWTVLGSRARVKGLPKGAVAYNSVVVRTKKYQSIENRLMKLKREIRVLPESHDTPAVKKVLKTMWGVEPSSLERVNDWIDCHPNDIHIEILSVQS